MWEGEQVVGSMHQKWRTQYRGGEREGGKLDYLLYYLRLYLISSIKNFQYTTNIFISKMTYIIHINNQLKDYGC